MSRYISPQGYSFLPPVVKNILIINVLLYIITIALLKFNNFDLSDILGLHYWGSEKFFPFQFVTYMFMHSTANFAHLFFNMFALWMFGSSLENVWGGKRFLTFYMITGIGAALFHYFVFYLKLAPSLDVLNSVMENPSIDRFLAFVQSEHFYRGREIVDYYNQKVLPVISSSGNEAYQTQAIVEFLEFYKVKFLNAPTVVGASGSVFGLLLAFGMTFPNALIYLFFAIPIKAKYLVIGYGLIELWSGLSNNPNDNVAHFAHLGGMIFGFFLLLYWKKNQFKKNRWN